MVYRQPETTAADGELLPILTILKDDYRLIAAATLANFAVGCPFVLVTILPPFSSASPFPLAFLSWPEVVFLG